MEIRTLKQKQNNGETPAKCKVIINQSMARAIIRGETSHGKKAVLVDIKPDKSNRAKTVFVFEDNDDFQEIFEAIVKERHERSQNRFVSMTTDSETSCSPDVISEIKSQLKEVKE
jgi:hypothetical protein